MILSTKLTFSLIAISALLISGSGFMVQEASAAAPTFTANHLNTTVTEIVFSEGVNGTKAILDWAIMKHSCLAPCLSNPSAVAGPINQLTQVAITDVTNGTVPSGTEISHSTTMVGYAALGYLNDSTKIYLRHSAIDSDATYFINYTANLASANQLGQIQEDRQASQANTSGQEQVVIGFNATGKDMMAPTVVLAEIVKSNPNQIRFTMSETIVNINATGDSGFSISRTSGIGHSEPVPSTLSANNQSKFMYLNFLNAAQPSDVLVVSYATTTASKDWITDGINTERYGIPALTDYKHGNRLVNFTGAAIITNISSDLAQDGRTITNLAVNVVNWLQLGFFGDVTTCYDCLPPTVTKVQVSLDSSTPITITDNNPVQINAGIDDTVSVMVTVADNLGADTIPFAGLYTNFGETPDNLYYANNFDSAKQMSTSYYEWNVRNDDVAFDNDGAISWTDATAQVNSDRTQTFTYTMTINDSITSSQVWVDIGDKIGNYAKIALPITLEVSGAPAITFASDDSQKVVSFFNESILLAIVSQWTATSSDDASNVEQLSSVLGIESQLPTWTTELASWVADDKIDVADMIVAVEYVINL
jgi:hypothetical protein